MKKGNPHQGSRDHKKNDKNQDNKKGRQNNAPREKSYASATRPAVPELPLLPYPMGDVEGWIKSLKPYASEKYDSVGRSIDRQDYLPTYKAPRPTTPWNDKSDPSEVERMLIKAKVNYEVTEEQKNENNKAKMVEFLFGQMRLESENIVKSHPDYVDIRAPHATDPTQGAIISAICQDPIRVLNIVRKTHKIGVVSDPNVSIAVSRDLYRSIRMYDNETIYRYKERFEAAIESLSAAGGSAMASSEITADFINGLHRGRFANFKDLIQNNALVNPASYPQSVSDVVRLAETLKFGSKPVKADNAAVFNVKTSNQKNKGGNHAKKKSSDSQENGSSDTEKGSGPLCTLCQQKGHLCYKCPELETARKLLADKKDGSKRVSLFTVHEDDDGSGDPNDRLTFMTRVNLYGNSNVSVADIYAGRKIFYQQTTSCSIMRPRRLYLEIQISFRVFRRFSVRLTSEEFTEEARLLT